MPAGGRPPRVGGSTRTCSFGMCLRLPAMYASRQGAVPDPFAAVFLGENSRKINFTRDTSQWAGQSTKRLVFTFNDEASNRLGVGDVDRHG